MSETTQEAVRRGEIILRVLAEGGSVAITRATSTAGRCQFVVTTDEVALYDLLSEEDGGGAGGGLSERGPVATWDEALVLLDRYPWAALHPDVVHEDFRDLIWTAVTQRHASLSADEVWDKSRLVSKWRRLCFPEEGSHGGSIQPLD